MREWQSAEARAQIAAVIWETGGNVNRSAFLLGTSNSHLCKYLTRHNLRPEVEAARAKARRPDWLTNARRILAMDDAIGQIVEACKGKSEEEVAALITSSAIADSIEDPNLVAAYIVSLAAA